MRWSRSPTRLALAPGTPLGADSLVYVRELGDDTRFVAVGNDAALSGDGKTVAFQQDDQVYADAGGGLELISRSTGGAEGDGFWASPTSTTTAP